MRQLHARTALLTGASRGIGPHIARALARAGVHLALTARSQRELDALAVELRAAGVRAVPVAADLTSAASRESVVERVEAELGPIDILINNAGTNEPGRLHTRTAAHVAHAVELNLVAPIELTRRLLPAMLARRSGHVVHVASLGGKMPMPFFALYSATKYGLVGFNQALQAELHGTGVRSSAVCPGFVVGEGMWARLGGRVPPGLGATTPDRVARAVLKVLGDEEVERIVNPRPVAFAVALWGVAPRTADALTRLIGMHGFLRPTSEQCETATADRPVAERLVAQLPAVEPSPAERPTAERAGARPRPEAGEEQPSAER